ncbi:ORF-89 peptide [Chrysodeixis chalcites nucleopolyhedrovirus]|uniref:ORF-89 peptide n=1 Tax=Chrysodeixis chalcites nucleopolyhedrovirus TaxID=320432 RepID=Q4KSZ1_9ABAC|nr:ORF-89 peptide [Chrysodeixis chalcites nucleopolyhedrovirus]AAY84020.1 ORF-89 peptide [Chrysodeixis chalcites nucleopolyhedrovirus]AGC36303.1 hypothetical protein TF1A_0089 [Chrysodeixis chalcites SNPV TF1-A]AGE61495.1 hypothetical protein [Chrysodeixis chalcites nucleopolyhedrovirus]AGE61649.1 hypothetical protein [Chrysodeixis chalcites nucleopolyhedrovirus]
MGHFLIQRESIFDDLIESSVGFQDVDKFDFIKDIIVNTDVLERDCADFMDPNLEFNITAPIYELCHESLLKIIWIAKYGPNCFLPEFWTFFIRKYNGKCYKCDNRAQLRYPKSCNYCDSDIRQFYYHDDGIIFEELVNDDNNYCSSCRKALFDIVDVYQFNHSICRCDY